MNYFSHGKLLITGEYLILKGARALAVPVKYGQAIEIRDNSVQGYLTWESFESDKCWFTAKIDITFFKIIESSNEEIAKRLLKWLLAADQLNPGFLKRQNAKKVIVRSDFNLSWGLGSSSSLLSDIAWWANVDPFRLHNLVSKGSGYDVVCARAEGPVFFSRQREDYTVEKTDFNPAFADQVYFIYLGHKQDSAKSVNAFLMGTKSLEKEVESISGLTLRIASAGTLDEFETCMREHEDIISSVLQMKKIKEERFADLHGEIKSLGAWGGDFAMITWHDTREELIKYLATKNIYTIFNFDELIKTS